MSRGTRDAFYRASFPALARRRPQVPAQRSADLTKVFIGHKQNGEEVFVDERTFLTHLSVFGTTGSGKSSFSLQLFLDHVCRRGRGALLIDPHGSHPDSLFNNALRALETHEFHRSGRVHVLDFSSGYVVPINFLKLVDGTASSVVADAALEAISAVWNDEDPHSRPTTRIVLRSTKCALAELNLPMTAARDLFDLDDKSGFRRRTIDQLTPHSYAHRELMRIDAIARSPREFQALTLGPINRVSEFLANPVIAAMLGVVDAPGQPPCLDLLEVLDRGDIVLFNASHTKTVSEADTRLVGALLLRYLFLYMSRRRNREPFFCIVDEAHRYLSADVPSLLAEARKYGVSMQLNLQYTAQAGKPDELIYRSLFDCVNSTFVFQPRSPTEAQLLAEHVQPFNLEQPYITSRPTAVGHQRTMLRSRSRSEGQSVTESESESETNSFARSRANSLTSGRSSGTTAGVSLGESTSASHAIGSAQGAFTSMGESYGQSLQPEWVWMGPNLPDAVVNPAVTGESQGETMGSGSSEVSSRMNANAIGSSRNASYGESESESFSETHSMGTTESNAVGSSRGVARSTGVAETSGAAETFETIWQNLPVAYHSLDAIRYMAGETLRRLKVGECYVSTNGQSLLLKIPPPPNEVTTDDTRERVARVMPFSRFAMPLAEAKARAAAIFEEHIAAPKLPEPEPIEATPFPPVDDAQEFARTFWETRNPTSSPPAPKTSRKKKLEIIDGGKTPKS